MAHASNREMVSFGAYEDDSHDAFLKVVNTDLMPELANLNRALKARELTCEHGLTQANELGPRIFLRLIK
ncbi:MAG: hypothetical protein M0P19_09545 [Nevskia sp.]|jgi:hypothetical protein|nr:hypothetical protein [Nevskia sp.]MCK9386020.1 hypothetical protein [Nevskia sp.]